MKAIEIIIALDGSSRLETRGFGGATCRDASRFLKGALGTVTAESLTAEFHVEQVQSQNQTEQKG